MYFRKNFLVSFSCVVDSELRNICDTVYVDMEFLMLFTEFPGYVPLIVAVSVRLRPKRLN